MTFAQRLINDTPLVHFLKQFAFNLYYIPDGDFCAVHQRNHAFIIIHFFDGTGSSNVTAAVFLFVCPEIVMDTTG